MAGWSSTSASTVSPAEIRTRTPGSDRPSSSAVRACPTTGARRPRWPHSGHAQAEAFTPHQRHAGAAAGPVVASGPVQAAQRAEVRQRSQASAAAYPLLGVWTRTGPVSSALRISLVSLGGQPRRPGERVALQSAVVGTGDADGDPLPQRPRSGELVSPAALEQHLGLDAAGEATDQRRGALALRAQEQDLSGVGVGRTRLGVQIVAVVPDHHQAEVVDRREGGSPGADDDSASAAGHREELPVATCRTHLRSQRDVLTLPQHRKQCSVHPGDVLAVRDADQHAPSARLRRRRGVRDERGQSVPGAAPRRLGGCHRPRGGGGTPPPGACAAHAASAAPRRRAGARRCRGLPPLGGGVPFRDREAQHVRAGAGVALRDLFRQSARPGAVAPARG